MPSERNLQAEYVRRRKHPCARAGCERFAVVRGGCCSRFCMNAKRWYALTPEERRAKGKRMAAKRWAQAINRMLQRVKVLADSEDQRLVLAWRYGLAASKARRYRAKQGTRQTEAA